jgi:hypothetical protein
MNRVFMRSWSIGKNSEDVVRGTKLVGSGPHENHAPLSLGAGGKRVSFYSQTVTARQSCDAQRDQATTMLWMAIHIAAQVGNLLRAFILDSFTVLEHGIRERLCCNVLQVTLAAPVRAASS